MAGSALCIANFEKMVTEINEGIKKAVNKWGDEVLKDSQDNFCPVDKGDLKASAKKTIETNTKTEFFVRLSYSTPYAIYVHEIPGLHHPHGQYKYLQTPFNIATKRLNDAIEKAMKEAIK